MRAVVLGLALTLGLIACRPAPVVPPDLGVLPDAEEVLAGLRAQAGVRTSLRTLGRVTYFGDRGRVRLKAVLLARRPSAFRVETLSPFEQPIDVMASDGERLWLLSQDRLRYGAATPANISRLLPLVMGPEAVVDTLLGGIPEGEGTKAERLQRADDGRWQLFLSDAQGNRGMLVVDPVKRRVEEMHLLGPADKSQVVVKFSDFEPVTSGGELPEKIEIRLEAQKSDVTIHLNGPEVNVELPDSLFTIEAPPGLPATPIDAE